MEKTVLQKTLVEKTALEKRASKRKGLVKTALLKPVSEKKVLRRVEESFRTKGLRELRLSKEGCRQEDITQERFRKKRI